MATLKSFAGSRITGLGAAMMLVAAVASATGVTVAVRIDRTPQTATEVLRMQLFPVAGGDPLELPVPLLSKRADVELPSGTRWSVQVSPREKYWSAPVIMEVLGKSVRQEIPIQAAGHVVGRARGTKAPLKAMSVTFTAAQQGFPVAPDVSRCAVDSTGRFVCGVPLGVRDVRLRVADHAPLYFWNKRIDSAEAADLGEITFAAGGTIAGPIVLPGGAKGLRVIVKRHDSAREGAPGTVMAMTNGPYFATGPLEPGLYHVTAEGAQGVRATADDVLVKAGLEIRLEPLELQTPLPLTIHVDPPETSSGHPWHVQLYQVSRYATRRSFGRGKSGPDGAWDAGGVPSGTYRVEVLDEAGSRWTDEEISVSAGSADVTVKIPLIPTSGVLRRGQQPAAGSLWFGGRDGIPSIQFTADDSGEFNGSLPRSGHWTVDVAVKDEPALVRTHAQVHLSRTGEGRATVQLQGLRLAGRVIDTGGNGIAGAHLAVSRGGEGIGSTSSGPTGHFSLSGLTAGPVMILAKSVHGDSELTPGMIAEPPALIQIVVHRPSRLTGIVHGNVGPVPGARVAIWPDAGTVEINVTDSTGSFSLPAPPNARIVNIAVISPGHALYLGRVLTAARHFPSRINLTPTRGTLRLENVSTDEGPFTIEHAGVALPVPLLADLLLPASSASSDFRSVQLRDLAPGPYRVCVGSGSQRRCADVTVVPGTMQLVVVGQKR